MTIALSILAGLLLLIGFVGCVVPVLPGPIIGDCGLLALIPTEKGIRLIAVAPEQLASPETTGRWEKGLSDIARGRMQPEKFMASIRRYCAFLCDYAASAPPQTFPKEEYKPKRKSAAPKTAKRPRKTAPAGK